MDIDKPSGEHAKLYDYQVTFKQSEWTIVKAAVHARIRKRTKYGFDPFARDETLAAWSPEVAILCNDNYIDYLTHLLRTYGDDTGIALVDLHPSMHEGRMGLGKQAILLSDEIGVEATVSIHVRDVDSELAALLDN